MANIKAKEKNIKKIKRATAKNRALKSQVKKAIKNVRLAVTKAEIKAEDLKALIAKAHKIINTAVSKKVYHKNNGARKIQRLIKYVNKHQK